MIRFQLPRSICWGRHMAHLETCAHYLILIIFSWTSVTGDKNVFICLWCRRSNSLIVSLVSRQRHLWTTTVVSSIEKSYSIRYTWHSSHPVCGSWSTQVVNNITIRRCSCSRCMCSQILQAALCARESLFLKSTAIDILHLVKCCWWFKIS